MKPVKEYYLIEGTIFLSAEEYFITTVLGSCVSLCLWDPELKIGGMNHYVFDFWNGVGLPTPKYGNIAIPTLIRKMQMYGCKKNNLKAKIFGGSDMLSMHTNGNRSPGVNNIILAEEILKEENIPIIAYDVGGKYGRKIKFNTATGIVLVKRFISKIST